MHANLLVNGEYKGIHMLVEQVDDIFTKSRFGDDLNQGKGALYKEVWIGSSVAETYSKYLKYGKREDAFLAEIGSGLKSVTVIA